MKEHAAITIDPKMGRLLLKCPNCSKEYMGDVHKVSIELRCAMLEQHLEMLKISLQSSNTLHDIISSRLDKVEKARDKIREMARSYDDKPQYYSVRDGLEKALVIIYDELRK